MGDIDIPAGEVTRIASASEGRAWEVQIQDGNARFDKDPNRIKSDGRLRTRGDRGNVELSRGETLYAYSAEGATIYVTRGNFSFTLFSSTNVSRPADEATLEENVATEFSDIDGGLSVTIATDDLRGRNQVLTDWQTTGESYRLTTKEADGTTLYEIQLPPDDTPYSFDPSVPLPSGGEIEVMNVSVDDGSSWLTYTYK